MASTLWPSLCLVLFAHNLVDLMSDRHLLSYKIVEEGDVFFEEARHLNYLACTAFWRIQKYDSSFNEPAIHNVSTRIFLNHSVVSIEQQLNVSGLFHLNESRIFNGHVCFTTSKGALEEEGKPFNWFLRTYAIFSVFIYSKEKQPNFYERAYEKKDRQRSIYLRAYKQKVFGANHLRNADCSNRAHQIHHDRFSCLNRCLVKLKMSSGFYHLDDDGTFDLREIHKEKRLMKREANDENEALGVLKELIAPSATDGTENCLRQCPESGCFWEVMITLKIDDDYYRDFLQKEGIGKIDLKLNTYAAFYSMRDFYLQLFGLLALFTGTSVLRLLHAFLSRALPLVAQRIEPHLKNEKILKIFRLAHPNLKHVLTLLSLVFVLVQGLAMISEFQFHSNHPNRTSTLNFSAEPFSVVACFPIKNCKGTLLNKTDLKSIERHSKMLIYSGIHHMAIHTGNKRIQTQFHISDEVLFKGSKLDNKTSLSRCFRMDFDLDERHRKMPLTCLLIQFNTTRREFFLVERNRSFTSGLLNFRGLFYQQKVTKKRSKSSKKSKCRDYSNVPNCDSRRNCLDRCLSTRFIERYGSIPTNTVVSSSHLNLSSLPEGIRFSETADDEIEEECAALFNQTDCNEIRFEESPELVNSEARHIPQTIKIKLTYMNIVEREREYEPVKTLLDIVSLKTILFGSNAFGMLTTVLLFLSRILRLKWRRAYSVFLFLLASAGFLVHNVLIFRAIISGELHENEFFEKPQRYQMPSPILCFKIEKNIDENRRVTGEYLDDLTAEMTFQQAFTEIRYSNRTHEKTLNISELRKTKKSNFYSSPELELRHFYYFGMKCFKISLKVSYREEDFLLLQDKTVLRIYLDRSSPNKTSHTTFLHQQVDSSEIGGGFTYEVGKWGRGSNVHCSYSVEFELFRIVREDQFELLKDPRRLFQEKVKVNDVKTAQAMRIRFKENFNRTTDDFPLDGDFKAEVDDELFEQHAKIVSDQAIFKSLNFEQNVANTYTNVFYAPFAYYQPDFFFSFSFLVRRVVITNRENYTKLVVSLLNTLALWLDICVLDMGAWLIRFFILALHLYRLLISTRDRLNILRG